MLKKIGKRGDEKYWLIISLALGLIVLALALFFIFREYFSQSEIDWETCRQSVVLRGLSPETWFTSTKDLSALKCKTQAINIDYKDKIKAEREIAEAIAGCWYMVGGGEFRVFPKSTVFPGGVRPSSCIYCARIHIDDKVKNFYRENEINILEGLNMKMPGGTKTYMELLNPEEGKKALRNIIGWNKEGFKIVGNGYDWWGKVGEIKVFNLPEIWNPNKGDMFVVYSENQDYEGFNSDLRFIEPFIVFLQYEDFGELQKNWVWQRSFRAWICTSIESIPG